MPRIHWYVLVPVSMAVVACGGGGGGGEGGSKGSNHVWVADSSANAIYGYSFAQLTSTGAPSPAIGIGTGAGSQTYGMALSPAGSIWVALPSLDVVARYDAGQLKASGSPTPAATVASPFSEYVMLDKAGNLWVTRASTGGVLFRYQKNDIAGTGALTPAPALTLALPTSGNDRQMLLDPAGHLWILDKGDYSAISPTHMRAPDSVLTATGSQTLSPQVTITTTMADQRFCQGAAFDNDGNLWATVFTSATDLALIRYGAAQLTASSGVAPEAKITITGGDSLGTIAFDASGALWIADFHGRLLLHVPKSQLVGSGTFTAVPDVVITAPTASGNGLTGLVIDPTPPGSPIAH